MLVMTLSFGVDLVVIHTLMDPTVLRCAMITSSTVKRKLHMTERGESCISNNHSQYQDTEQQSIDAR